MTTVIDEGVVYQGKVVMVDVIPVGDISSTTYAAGATVIVLNDTSDFDGTGQCDINGALYTYVNDLPNNTLALTTGLTAAIDEAQAVLVYPYAEERIATVVTGDEEDAIRAYVPFSMADRLDVGIRGDDSSAESVLLTLDRGMWMIQEVVGLAPEINGAMISPGTVPPEASADGLPPTLSPTPSVVGGIGSFFIRWTPVDNHDAVTYNVYAGTVPAITPANAVLVGTTTASTMNARTLSDGTAFAYDSDYYFFTVASDVDGAAAQSGVAGPSQLRRATNDDVSADFVYANDIYANQIRGGRMESDITIGGVFKTAESGQRVEMGAFGLRQFGPDGSTIVIDLPNDPASMAKFSGIINAFGITVNDGLELRGKNNVFAQASVTTLATTTSGSSTAPTLSVAYETYDSGMTEYLNNLRGYHREVDGGTPYWASNFYGYSTVHWGSKSFRFPEITDVNGSKRSTRDIYSATMVYANGRPLMVTYGAKYTAGSGPTYGLEVLDLANLLVDGSVAPTSRQWMNIGTPSYVISYQVGRAVGTIGTTGFNRVFTWSEYNVYLNQDIINLRRYQVNDDYTISLYNVNTYTVNSPLANNVQNDGVYGVGYGNTTAMSFPGVSQDVWIIYTKKKAYVWDSTGSNRLPQLDFDLVNDFYRMCAIGNLANNTFVRFESTPSYNGTLLLSTKYTNNHWDSTTTPDTVWGGYTWFDSNPTGATTGTHETNVSVLTSMTAKKRGGLSVSVPDFPDPVAGQGQPRDVDDVNSFRVYLARQVAKPVRAQLWKQSVQPADLVKQVTYSNVPEFSGTTNPPLDTTFPTQAAAVIQSAGNGLDGLPKFKLTGNGYAHFDVVDINSLTVNTGYISPAMRYVTYKWSDATIATRTVNTFAGLGAKGGQGTFIAPPSGCVMIMFGGVSSNTTGGQNAAISVEVKTGATIGSGTSVYTPDVNESANNANTQISTGLYAITLTGLVAGATYNVRNVVAGGTSGTANFYRGYFIVVHMP